jgi:hypothetical protein
VRFEGGHQLFAVHVEVATADGNTCRVSLGNVFKAEHLKVSWRLCNLDRARPPAAQARTFGR